MTQHSTLRERLAVRYGNRKEESSPLRVPAAGRIDSETIAALQHLAVSARAGDNGARDRLFFAMRPRLDRRSWMLRPWPNTDKMIGIWDRGDVRQETYIIFVELLAAWNGKGGFVPYVLATFTWRLRDRILRGIGKRQTQLGTIRVSEDSLVQLLLAEDGDQPESAAIARHVLEEIIGHQMMGESEPGEIDAWAERINSERLAPLSSPDRRAESGGADDRLRVA